MRNPLQDQLLKAGLVKKSKIAAVEREQTKQRHGKAAVAPSAENIEAQRLQAERAERDRALAAERNAQDRIGERAAQVQQIVDAHRVRREGEIEYRFNDGGKIRSVLVNELMRGQLANGTLVIVRHGSGYELIPRPAAEKVVARDASFIVLDHAHDASIVRHSDDDEFYRRFQVPDDLTW